MAHHTTQSKLTRQGYTVRGKHAVAGPCPGQDELEKYGADSAFRHKDGEWIFCKNNLKRT